MSKVFISVGMSLDGYIAGPNGGPKNPLGDGGTEIHKWIYTQKAFLEHLGISGEGETGTNNDVLQQIFDRTGANIMGKGMFEEGEANWPEEAPFRTPVYVLTHQPREPWERKGGTTFYFINDGIESALEKARKAAGNKDVRISGGANCIQQYLNAGLVDELSIQLAPIILGQGVRLFDHIDKTKCALQIADVIHTNDVTHLRYSILKK